MSIRLRAKVSIYNIPDMELGVARYSVSYRMISKIRSQINIYHSAFRFSNKIPNCLRMREGTFPDFKCLNIRTRVLLPRDVF